MLDRPTRLLLVLAIFFSCNALIAEFIGVKIFALEDTLGLAPFDWELFGQKGSLNFTAGVLLWPAVFIATDIVNEYFGARAVRTLSFIVVGFILYAFAFAYIAIALAPASWWVGINAARGVADMQAAFATIFGQGLWTIGGSLTAFAVGQLVDVAVFQRIRRRTGPRFIGLRATGSTAISQFIDSYIVLYIAFVIGPQQWPLELFFAVGTVNYLYKLGAAVALTPLIYLSRYFIDAYLGAATAQTLKNRAAA